jgi:PAS domain S-box-containing protein
MAKCAISPRPLKNQRNDRINPFQRLVDTVTGYAVAMLTPQGNVASWNAGAALVTGYKAAEIIGKSFVCFFTPEDCTAGRPARALAVTKQTGRFEEEGWRVRKDGTYFWALSVIEAIRNPRGELMALAKITRDMTEPRAPFVKLRESDNQWRLLIENLVDYTIVTLSSGGCVADWNNGAKRMTGYERADIIGRHFAAFLTEEDQREGEPERALVAASVQGRGEAEGWLVRKDRSRF